GYGGDPGSNGRFAAGQGVSPSIGQSNGQGNARYGSEPAFGNEPSLGNEQGFANEQGFGNEQAFGNEPRSSNEQRSPHEQGFGGEQRSTNERGFGNEPGFGDEPGFANEPGFGNAAPLASRLSGPPSPPAPPTRDNGVAPAPVEEPVSAHANQGRGAEANSGGPGRNEWPIQPMRGEPPLTLFRGLRLLDLAPGTEIDRFGVGDGNLTYAVGTPFEQRSLVPDWVHRPYHVYRVRRPFQALAGNAIPWFEQPGGGTAYLLPYAVNELIEAGDVIEVEAGDPPA
ncbi:MAG TPA: TNT domain-containing protein, partial [Pseudonocardiaceae bacterium]